MAFLMKDGWKHQHLPVGLSYLKTPQKSVLFYYFLMDI